MKTVVIEGARSLFDAKIIAKPVEDATCPGRRPVSLQKIFKCTKLWQAATIYRTCRQIAPRCGKIQRLNEDQSPSVADSVTIAAGAQLPKSMRSHHYDLIHSHLQKDADKRARPHKFSKRVRLSHRADRSTVHQRAFRSLKCHSG